ncbi:NUDIX hydrolase [Nostocoides australiense]
MHRSVVDVHLILQRSDGHILLAERAGIYGDGLLNIPGGKLEAHEDVRAAAVREAWEETGVFVNPDDARCVAVIHHRNPYGESRVGFFFATTRWTGEPVNAEPTKCRRLLWANPDQPPAETIAYSAAGLRAWRTGTPAALDGWTNDDRDTSLRGLDMTPI